VRMRFVAGSLFFFVKTREQGTINRLVVGQPNIAHPLILFYRIPYALLDYGYTIEDCPIRVDQVILEPIH
jgi:hypothetical protein